MKKQTRPTFGANRLLLSLPTSWGQLSQKWLKFIYSMFLHEDMPTTKTAFFIKYNRIEVLRRDQHGWQCAINTTAGALQFALKAWEVYSFLDDLAWMDEAPSKPVRLEKIGTCKAADADLHGVSFSEYLQLENLYQGYLASGKFEALHRMAALLYTDGEGRQLEQADESEVLSVFYWWTSVKKMFASLFPDFFRPAGGSGDIDMRSIMDAQIRALTGGDITKEQQVLDMDCWRALTELNAKARETKELEKKYKTKK